MSTIVFLILLGFGNIQRPLGLILDHSSLAHRHFAIEYLCLHSFLYDEAQEAFDLAINNNATFIESYIGKLLGYKQALWSYTDFTVAQATYNISNITLTDRQSSLLSTSYHWYANASNVKAGERAFLSSIANLSQTHPNETDIAVLWGLSLLNVAGEAQFQSEMQPQPILDA